MTNIKSGFYVYFHAPNTVGDHTGNRPVMRLVAGPFREWAGANEWGPKVVAHMMKAHPEHANVAGVTFGICRLESPVLPVGELNAVLWVPNTALVD